MLGGRQLASKLFGTEHTFKPLFDYLRTLKLDGQSLMLGEGMQSVDQLRRSLFQAEKELRLRNPEVAKHASLVPERRLQILHSDDQRKRYQSSCSHDMSLGLMGHLHEAALRRMDLIVVCK